jgi:hypothetical protein
MYFPFIERKSLRAQMMSGRKEAITLCQVCFNRIIRTTFRTHHLVLSRPLDLLFSQRSYILPKPTLSDRRVCIVRNKRASRDFSPRLSFAYRQDTLSSSVKTLRAKARFIMPDYHCGYSSNYFSIYFSSADPKSFHLRPLSAYRKGG